MREEQVLSHRERDLNTSAHLGRAIAVSAAAHLLLILLLIVAPKLLSAPKPIIPSPYMVRLVTAPKAAPASLLEEEKKPRPRPPERKSPERKKQVKNEVKPIKKEIPEPEKKIVPKKEAPAPPPPKKELPPEPVKKEPPRPAEPVKKEAPEASKTVVTEGVYFPYVWYLKIMERRVTENWITHGIDVSGMRADPVVRFRIAKDGSVFGLSMERSSGSPALDQSAMDAVRGASPFPPLPEDFAGDSLGVHFGFSYEQRLD